MAENKEKELFLIDGSAILYRSFYGLASLTSSKGVPTQAVYGFFRTLKRLIKDFSVKNLAVAWDNKESLRKEIFPDYKSKRKAAPDELLVQKDYIVKILEQMNILQLNKSGIEADDILASLSEKFKKDGIVFVVSPDKDLLQLVKENVFVFDPVKWVVMDEKKVEEKFSIPAEKINFYHSILGDSSDGIPGVSGIGAKGALDLAKKFSDLEDLFENLEKVEKQRTKKLLKEGRESAFLSQKLFSFLPFKNDLTFQNFSFSNESWKNPSSIFFELDLKSLAQGNYENDKSSSEELKEYKNFLITDKKSLLKLIDELSSANVVAIDLETTGVDFKVDKIVGISVSKKEKEAFYIPILHKDQGGELVKPQIEKDFLKEKFSLFLKSDVKKVFHNAKFDLHFLKKGWGVDVKNVYDSAILARLLLPEWRRVGLKSLSVSELGINRESCSDVLKNYKDFSFVPVQKALDYAGLDASQTFMIFQKFSKELEKKENSKIKRIFKEVELPLLKILLEMESLGIKVSSQKLDQIGENIEKELLKIKEKLCSFLQTLENKSFLEMNFNSPKQVSELLYDVLELPVPKKSKKGSRSTDVKALEELSEKHFVPDLILKYRKMEKLSSTFVKALKDHIFKETGRIHTDFSQILVSTGRLSSQNPNLQNIPSRSDEKFNIRSAFVAREENILISADYSQIELRVLAFVSKDENLLKTFKSGGDIHLKTAANIFSKNEEAVEIEERHLAKVINFSVLYGLTPFSLAKRLKIKKADAKDYIETFFKTYPKVQDWMNKSLKEAEKNGFIQTVFGRKRWFSGLNDRNKIIAEAERRAAINAIIQGSAADIMKMAMVKLSSKLKETKSELKILLQVHDEIVAEIKKGDQEAAINLIKDVFENVVDWDPKLQVNIKTGKSWGEMDLKE